MPRIFMMYMTFPGRRAALRVGRALVEQRLVACVNVTGPVRSLYWWSGRVQNGDEVVLFAKTSARRVRAAMSAARRLHPYECPCLVAWPLEKGHAPFFAWVATETSARK